MLVEVGQTGPGLLLRLVVEFSVRKGMRAVKNDFGLRSSGRTPVLPHYGKVAAANAPGRNHDVFGTHPELGSV